MDTLFFGVKTRRTPTRKTRRNPTRKTRRTPTRKTRRTPTRKTRRTPRRKTTMCNKKLSLPKLRKLALEHGVNIFSEKKTSISKRTGMPKKPKMVGCSTLMKRLNEAGLSHLYKVRKHTVMQDDILGSPEELFMEEEVSPTITPSKDSIHSFVYSQADPACHDKFLELAKKQPDNRSQAKFLKEYKGYVVGQGPCDQRELVPMHIHGDEENIMDYADVADFDMSYGTRHVSGARPKKTQKHIGTIVVKGRIHHVFKGTEGGLYYLKGKTGRKIYIDKTRLKKRKRM